MSRRKRRRRPDPRKKYGVGVEWHDAFCATFRETASIRRACEEVGIGRTTYAKALREHPEFAAAFKEAKKDAIDLLEERARDMAMLDGNTQLMILLLKSWKPKRYRDPVAPKVVEADTQKISVNVYIPQNGRDPLSQLPPPPPT